MSDEPGEHDPAERKHIDLDTERDVHYWTTRFGCSRAELEQAIRTVGAVAAAVEIYLTGT